MPTIAYDASMEALLHPERRATILGLDPAPTRTALAIEAARLAYVRAEEDNAERTRLTSDLARAGFAAPATFHDPDSDSQGFAALRASDGLALVAFRGTQADKATDLLTDLQAWKTRMPPWPGEVHAGFARASLALLPGVETWLAREGAMHTQLLLCGHSLGAAIATLVATRLASAQHPATAQVNPVQLVTLGSPRVGDAAFASAFATRGVLCTRVVNSLDVVTRLPPALMDYEHVGVAEFIDAQGKVAPTPPRPQADASDTLEDLARSLARRARALPRRLTDHAPVNYLRAYWP